MKKIALILGIIFLAPKVHAILPEEFNYIPFSSYTDVATPGVVLFSSAAVQWVAITISSPTQPADISYVAIYRSTSPVMLMNNVSTQVLIATNFGGIGNPITIPLFEMKNDSFTYISKVGNAKLIYWIRYPKQLKGRSGTYPGMNTSGQKGQGQIEFPQP